ncbi:hypothetical protein V2J09_015076 [Rumex salicifolius]
MEAKQSYYTVLGVNSNSSLSEIRRAYRRLAMQWHPDRWASTPSLLGEANRKFQKIQEAYSVLSDPAKRTVYDAGLYDPTDEYDEGFCGFMQEMLDLMAQVKEEEKGCSLEELQNMFSETFNQSAAVNNRGCSSSTSHWNTNPMFSDMFGMSTVADKLA